MKLNMGLVGGGEGAFIGAVHRMAAELDGRIRLTCGAFSSDPAKSRRAGVDLYGIEPARSYGTYQELMAEEAQRPGRRAHGFRGNRHPQRHALCHRSSRVECRFSCYVR